MSFGLLFAGQGTQHAQMLPWLDDEDALVRQTEAALAVPSWRRALHDPVWAARNRNVQILLTGIGLAAWGQLSARMSARLPPPAAIAGYSVGELAAFSAAGVFDAGTAVELAAERADAMDRCAAAAPGGLLAVSGLLAAAIDTLCNQTGVAVAIRIAEDAVVLGGGRAALIAAEQLARAAGAVCTPLNVGIASHTPAMRPAAEAFAQVLERTILKAPQAVLFDNAHAERVHGIEQAARALSAQVAQTVRWADCLSAVHSRGVRCVLEIGPGSALAAMWNRRHPDVPARSADEFRDGAAVVRWVLEKLA